MQQSNKWQTIVLTAVLALSFTTPVHAISGSGQGPIKKLGRGVTNIVTCPFEFILQGRAVERQDGPLAALSVGLLKGAVHTVHRGVVGVFEVVTFFLEIPEGYEPIKLPEFVYDDDKGWAED